MPWFGNHPEHVHHPLSGDTSPIPEGIPGHNGFRVRVENPDLILQAIHEGVSGDLGVSLLSDPLEKVDVLLESQGEEFNLIGQLRPTFAAKYERHTFTVSEIIRKLAEIYKANGPVLERGGNFIFIAPRGTKLVVGSRNILGHIEISTGKVEDIGDILQLVPAPKATPEIFDTVVSDFVQVLQTTVEEVYKNERKATPEEELVIRPPKQPIVPEGHPRPGGIFGSIGETTTPQELLGKLQIEKSNVTFEDIGGNQKAKREIEGLAFALKNPELYKKWGTRPPKGIVLYGPPGTGKTLMAKALAAQADASFFHVEAADIVSKWYGESTKIVKSIFDLANKNSGKTIIFFDEVDAIAPHREGAHEASKRIMGAMLENMDGMASNDNVMVVASTNRLEGIEPALLRAGRFDRWVEVPVPDEEGRKQILGIHITKAEQVAGRKLFENVSMETIAVKTEKLSGADLAEIVRRVLEEKVRQEGTTGQEPGLVTTDDVLKELGEYERVMKAKRNIGFAPSNGK
ncbi:MAG: AAA family ATPase [Patescibacteria group bacterium]|nr:AAA family ATPase [Patescibacteria group bacterium]